MTKKIRITKNTVIEKLAEVSDPEVNLSIVDLGLIYQVEVKKNPVTQIMVKMTLTTPGCPLFSYFEEAVVNKIKELKIDKKNIKVEFVFDPPWSIERISKKGRQLLGL